MTVMVPPRWGEGPRQQPSKRQRLGAHVSVLTRGGEQDSDSLKA